VNYDPNWLAVIESAQWTTCSSLCRLCHCKLHDF